MTKPLPPGLVRIAADATRQALKYEVRGAYAKGSTIPRSVVVHGGPGTGKTQHRERIAIAYGLLVVVDDINPAVTTPLEKGVLYLSPAPLTGVRNIAIADALMQCR